VAELTPAASATSFSVLFNALNPLS
jgi:hypothetical protein